MNTAFVLNFDSILADQRLPKFLIDTFEYIKDKQYLTVGEFLVGLTDENLEVLLGYLNEMEATPGQPTVALSRLTLLTMGLVIAEGSSMVTPDTIDEYVKTLVAMITLEAMFRDGEIHLFRDRLAFVCDDKSVWACKKSDIDKYHK